MKNNKMTREEKRRLLFKKKYVKDNNTLAAPGGAAEGVLTYTKKRLYAIIAVIVALAVLSSSVVFFIVKGASAAEGTHLDLNQGTVSGNDIILTVGSGGMDSGLYNVTYEGRTYVYDLQFDGEGTSLENTHKLVKGDQVIFNTQTKKITWVYNPSHNPGWINLSSLCENPSTSGSTTSLELKDDAALEAGKTYYYFDEATNNYYLFEIEDDLIGRKNASSTPAGQSDSLTYYYERKITDPELISSNENPIAVQIDKENDSISIVGDQLKRHQIYLKVKKFTNGKDYLIRHSDGQLITQVESNPNQNGLTDKGSSANNCGYTSLKHTFYSIDSINPALDTYGATTYYDTNGNAYSTLGDYYDGGANEDDLKLSEFRAKQYTHTVYYNRHGFIVYSDDSVDVTGFYLFGYDNKSSSNTYNCFTSDKTLGKMFNDTITDVKLYNLCEGSSTISSRSYNHNDNSLWIYDGGQLTTKYRGDSNNDTVQTGYLQKRSNDAFELVNNTTDTYELYERTSVYEETPYTGVDNSSIATDSLVTATVSPKSITYDETEYVDNGLELKKTVTDNEDDTFSVQLEAWTTRDRLDLPETDIVLVLDTSKNMNNVLYRRNYENLNTYATFSHLSLSNASYNDLHDADNKHNLALINISNDYSNRKYIEDPNNPGMMVYIACTYDYEVRAQWPFYFHKYKYSFTDNYGNVYESVGNDANQEWTEVGLADSTSISGTRVNSITFKLKSRAANLPADVEIEEGPFTKYEVYTRPSGNDYNYLNKNLYAISREGGGPGLYYKHTDGQFYEVHINREMDTFQAPSIWGSGTTVTQPIKYTYTMTIGDTTYTAVQGNEVYGAEYGVFQGFRNYVYDNDNDLTLDTSKPNLLSKSLYKYTGQDASGNGNTEVTAFQAMKESMEDFLLSSHYQALTKKAGVNIALITYDKDPTLQYTLDKSKTNYTYVNKSVGDQSIDNMVSAVYNYSVSNTWASELGEAMGAADNELQTYSKRPHPENRRYSAVFTAGVPADYTTWGWPYAFDTSSNTFSTGVADEAIGYANHMKNELDTTIYTVGLFDNANETKIHGKYWYYQFLEKVPCTGKANSYWGGSWVANFNYSMDPKDAYATNRMLAYISSDSSNVDSLGLTRGRYSPGTSSIIGYLVTRGYGYRINNAYTPEETGYYYGISPNTFNEDAASEDASASSLTSEEVNAILTDVFQDLQAAMAVPNAVLTEDATLVDGITKYFKMEEGATVTAYAATMDGQKVADLTPVISEDGKTVTVTGFNYSEHYVGIEQINPTKQAQKVVVKFDITREDDFIGGNAVPTNRSISGIYDGPYGDDVDVSERGVLEEAFDIPHADVSIQMDAVTKDDAVYYSNDEYLPNLLNEKWTDGTNNAFVDIVYTFKDGEGHTINTYTIPAGSSEGEWSTPMGDDGGNSESINYQMLDTTEFTIECEVQPIYSGTVDDKDIKDAEDNWYTSTVYVYQPHYDVHNDTVEDTGDTYDLTTIPTLSWIAHDSNGDALTGAEKTTADEYIEEKTKPNIAYDITKDGTIVTVTATLDEDGEYEYAYAPANYKTTKTVINETTDFTVANVNVTPIPVSYETIDIVEINYYVETGSGDDATIDLLYSYDPQTDTYYDAEGNVADKATAQAAIANVDERNIEEIEGIVTKTVNRQAVNASTNEDVTYMNTDDERTNGEFTIGLRSHDVIITNHTVKSEDAEADYADRTRAFPLTITLKDGNNPVVGEVIHYTDPAGDPQTATTDSNGQFVINLKHDQTATLAEIRDGYTLTVTSDPSDAYHVGYKYAEGDDALGPAQNVDIQTESATFTVSDDLTIDVTHSIDDIPITGYPDKSSMFNPFLILAAMLTIGGGAWGGYTYKRKKETELAAYQAGKSE